jgi:sigma-B regulation protein RsbU (phosphoserine phosphatase)
MTATTLTDHTHTAELARSRLLLHASETFSVTSTVADVLHAAAELTRSGLDAERVWVDLPGPDADPLTAVVIGERRTVFFEDGIQRADRFPRLTGGPWPARMCTPLVGARGVLGALHFAWSGPRRFSAGEVALTVTLAMYVARALDRAYRSDSRSSTAATLQRALLTTLPPADPYQIAAHYLPADSREQVGGDWYDAVPGPRGRLTAVIGDVAGHDMSAAARMGQLRSMFRAYAVDRDESPSALLRRLDVANHRLGDPSVATAVVAVLDTTEGGHRLRWSNAGHPPPVLIDRAGQVRSLTGHDVLIGVQQYARRHTWTCPLPPGATVLLYTDGLVERRGRSLDDGIARLRARVAGTGHDSLAEVLRAAAGPDTEQTDDIAMLAIRVPPAM